MPPDPHRFGMRSMLEYVLPQLSCSLYCICAFPFVNPRSAPVEYEMGESFIRVCIVSVHGEFI